MTPAFRPYPRKTFPFLVAAGTLTGPLVLPYFLGLQAIAPCPQPAATPLGQRGWHLVVLLTKRLTLISAGRLALRFFQARGYYYQRG